VLLVDESRLAYDTAAMLAVLTMVTATQPN
jgi:hypothetical protein